MPTTRIYTSCTSRIHNSSKTCPYCSAKQPTKQKLLRSRQEFHNVRKRWAATVMKNHNKAAEVDKVYKQLDKLSALDLYPLLLVGRMYQGSFLADIMTGGLDFQLEDSMAAKLKKIFESMMKSMGFIIYIFF